jgi:hypothetical protein
MSYSRDTFDTFLRLMSLLQGCNLCPVCATVLDDRAYCSSCVGYIKEERVLNFKLAFTEEKMQSMKTDHLFNYAKMIFNHLVLLAEDGELVKLKEPQTSLLAAIEVNPDQALKIVEICMKEVKKRGDLSENLKEYYYKVLKQLAPNVMGEYV